VEDEENEYSNSTSSSDSEEVDWNILV
jgi:hypothetical protein